ncbi:MAG: MGMT family protein [Planctomycetes bacterium]|nr:MGMT family protein [Planctomycetota bacterium]
MAHLTIGHASRDEVRAAVRRREARRVAGARGGGPDAVCPIEEADWNPDLRLRLERYAAGERIDFAGERVQLPELTKFQRRVVDETRRIGYGRTLSYGELAARAGSPRAARAVGAVMAANRIPLFVPCHRVVASGGGLGGFSAPQGVGLKRRLLVMEADGVRPLCGRAT